MAATSEQQPSATTGSFDPKVLLSTYWDSKDVDSFVNCFVIDATWKVNTSPEVSGKDAIKGLTKAVMATTKSSRHHDLSVIVSQTNPFIKTYVVHGSVEYEMLDELKPNVNCRFCDIFDVTDSSNKILKCWTYMDTTPLVTTTASTATTESTTESS